MIDENGLRERTLKLIEFLLNQSESANVNANDIGGFLAGYFGRDSDLHPEDEIEIF